MKPGYFKHGNKWVKATLLAGPYDFKNAVRVRLHCGTEIIAEASRFAESRPLTERQTLFAKRRAELAAWRKEYAAAVIAEIGSERRLGELMSCKILGIWGAGLPGRILHWPEFDGIHLDWRGGKRWVVNPKKK